MPAFIEHIRQVIIRHRMLAAEDHVLVGVSGGADSVAVALALIELGWRIGIAHLNHGLRGADSDEDEVFVAKLARAHRVPLFSKRVNLSERGHNLEAAGRAARKEFFASIRETHGYTRIALGHNRQDRVETFLLNLLRGAGTQGLASMAPVSGDIVRPLIESDRPAIEAWLRDRAQSWRIDRTNSDMSFSRNRLRHEVIPALASSFNTRLVDTLARTITVLADEDALLREMAQAWVSEHVTGEDQEAILPARALRQEAPGLVRRVIRGCLERSGSHLTDVTFDQIENVRHLLEQGQSGKTVELPGDIHATREFDRLVLRPKQAEPAAYRYLLHIPGVIHIPEAGCTVRASIVDSFSEESQKTTVLIDAAKLDRNEVEIRSWRPGDYYRPMGLASGKVKKLFQKARIPRNRRKDWPVVAQASGVLWVVYFPVSRDHAAGTNSEKIVAFEVLPD